MNKYSRQDLFVAVIMFCYPILLLTQKGGMNAAFFILLAISLLVLVRDRRSVPPRFDATARIFAIAMTSNVAVIFLSQLAHGDFDPHPYDGASRFLLAVPIYLMLKDAGQRTATVLQYSLPLGALSALALSLMSYKGGRVSSYFLDPIHLGDLALMLGFLSLFSINWTGPDRPRLLLLKLAGWAAGIVVSILSGSRGGWLAIPVLLIALIALRSRERLLGRMAAFFATIVVAAIAGYFLIDSIHQRAGDFINDLSALSQGKMDTSLGIRLQLWKAALYLFWQHPLFGVGPDGFAQMMAPLSQSGFISEIAAELGRGEVHNDILASMARLGVFGLLSILAIYLVPLTFFLKTVRSTDSLKRGAAQMGVCLVLGFVIFGLTVETINMKMVAAFYSLTVAVLLAAATNIHETNSGRQTG